jgi:hypothetical protein
VPRLLQLVALTLAFLVSGAPAWAAELVRDDCGDECAGDETSSCPEQGCTDCAFTCSSCPRVIALAWTHAVRVAPVVTSFAWLTNETGERVPDDPVPEGVFHPPRLAG